MLTMTSSMKASISSRAGDDIRFVNELTPRLLLYVIGPENQCLCETK